MTGVSSGGVRRSFRIENGVLVNQAPDESRFRGGRHNAQTHQLILVRGYGRKPRVKTSLRKWTPCVSRGTLDACVWNGTQKRSPAAICQVPREQEVSAVFRNANPTNFGLAWEIRRVAESPRRLGQPSMSVRKGTWKD